MSDQEEGRDKWVLIVEMGPGPAAGRPMLLVDEDDVPVCFPSAEAARAAARGAMWEEKWVWWVVPLREGGVVEYGLAEGGSS